MIFLPLSRSLYFGRGWAKTDHHRGELGRWTQGPVGCVSHSIILKHALCSACDVKDLSLAGAGPILIFHCMVTPQEVSFCGLSASYCTLTCILLFAIESCLYSQILGPQTRSAHGLPEMSLFFHLPLPQMG